MSVPKTITHNDCVYIAANWLSNQRDSSIDWRCKVVLREPTGYIAGYGDELPDVLGVWDNSSVNIECKVSRSDFLSDKNKLHDHPIGNHKIYACPNNMIQPAELPEGWGLLYVDQRGGRLIVPPKYQKAKASPNKFLCDIILNGVMSGALDSSHLRRPKNRPQWDGKAVML